MENKGFILGAIKANPSVYVKQSMAMQHLLASLRSHGKVLFLISNLGRELIDVLLNYSLGPRWAERFFIIVEKAQKPLFYSMKAPFNKSWTTMK